MERPTTKLLLIHKRPYRRKDSAGAAIVEFAITLPFLLLLFLGAYDLGRWLQLYFSANRVAYEGARFAATFPGLGTDGEVAVRNRMRDLILINDLPDAALTDVVLPTAGDNTVTVSLSAGFVPTILPVSIQVRAQAVAPYLYSVE